MSTVSRGGAPTDFDSYTSEQWEVAFRHARRAASELLEATFQTVRDAAMIVYYRESERPERADDQAMERQRDRLTARRQEFIDAFNAGKPSSSYADMPPLSPSALYDAAAESPPFVVPRSAFNYHAVFEYATATLQIGWRARPGEGWGMLWPALSLQSESSTAYRLATPDRWDFMRFPCLIDDAVKDALSAALSRESRKAEGELRRRIETAQRIARTVVMPRKPPIETPPATATRSTVGPTHA